MMYWILDFSYFLKKDQDDDEIFNESKKDIKPKIMKIEEKENPEETKKNANQSEIDMYFKTDIEVKVKIEERKE
jgi:hypothetical protein